MEFALIYKVVTAAVMLLSCTFMLLWLFKKVHPSFAAPTQTGIIKILDKKSDLAIGTIAVVSVLEERYVLLVAKSGVAIHALDVKPERSMEDPIEC